MYNVQWCLIWTCCVCICSSTNPKLREQAVEVLRDLIGGHDCDLRYGTAEARSRIASLYLPLLSVVMDNYHRLYKVHVLYVHTYTHFIHDPV